MQNSHSLQEQKYPGPEYFFQAIEMASEETCSELELEADFFSWKVVKRRQKPQRRYTVSHSAPPAPPSTPTSSLSKDHDPLSELSLSMSPTEYNGNGTGGTAANGHINNATNDDCRLGSLLYILDYAPKYKKKLKEQQRTDTELAELFKVVTITGGSASASGSGRGNGIIAGNANGIKQGESSSKSKSSIEHGVSLASRRIRRADMNAGVFRIHRNPDESFRDLNDEDSLSAPELDADTEDTMAAIRPWRRLSIRKYRCRKQLRDRYVKRMNEIVETFDSTMSFQSAQ